MRLFLSFLGLFIFYLGVAQSQISATSRFDIQQWDSDRIPVILKINDEFDVSYIQNVGGKMGSHAYLAIIPGVCIMLLVMSFNFLGNALRDALDVKFK